MRYWTSSLTARLITNFLAISALGLISTTLVAFFIIRTELTQSVYDRLEAVSTLKEVELNRWVNDLRDEVVSLGQTTQLRSNLQNFNTVENNSFAQDTAKSGVLELINLEVESHPSLQEISILSDTGGVILISTTSTLEGESRLNEKYYAQGRLATWIQNPYSPAAGGVPAMIISTPVRDTNGDLLGVIAAQINLERLDTLILESAGLGATGKTYLVDPSNIILSTSRLEGVPQPQGVHSEAIDTALKGLDGFGLYENFEGTPVLGVYHWIDNRDVAIVAELNQQEAFAPAQRVAVTLLLLGLFVGLILTLGTFIIARQMTRPVLAISQAAAEVSRGNLNVSAPVITRDELGVLATTFNQMTDQLRQLVGNLEDRVAERTAELKSTTVQSERRANNLQTVSELARIISTEQEMDNLLPLITRLVSDRFGYYHVGIFMLDDARRFAVLRSANSEGGQRMLEEGHRLEVGMVGIVGEVAAAGKPRIAHDVGKDAFFFNNPFLPETRSEVALPLRVTGQIIGVLDVQSKDANAFPDEQVEVLTTLADQITIAIQNARSMVETRKLLFEAQTAAGGAVREYWQVLQSQKQTLGYELSGSVLKPLVNPIELPANDHIGQDGRSVIYTTEDGKTRLSIPLQLRGQVVGALNLRIPDAKKWKPDDIDIVNAIAERLSLALETATLMQATQRRAAKEQAISEITSRIGASVNMRNVLQTAVEELGRALPGSEVEIDFKSNNQSEVSP